MNLRLAVGAVALTTLTPLAVLAPQAASASTFTATITAHATDTTPASGQTFRTVGRFTINGHPAVDHVVKVQTFRNGAWQQLKGAKMLTNNGGDYKMRIILQQKGLRHLRAVGVTGDGHPNAFKQFTVTVH